MMILQVDPELVGIAKQFSSPAEQLVIYLAGVVMIALVTALGIIWTSYRNELKYSKDQDSKNLETLHGLKAILESLSKGIEINIPKQLDDFKQHVTDRIDSLHKHQKP